MNKIIIFLPLLLFFAGCVNVGSQFANFSHPYSLKLVTTFLGENGSGRLVLDGMIKNTMNDTDTVFSFQGTESIYVNESLVKQTPVFVKYVFDPQSQDLKSAVEYKGLSLDVIQESMVFVNWTERAESDSSIKVIFDGQAEDNFCPPQTKKTIKSVLELFPSSGADIIYMNITQCLGDKYYSYGSQAAKGEIQLLAQKRSSLIVSGGRVIGESTLISQKQGT